MQQQDRTLPCSACNSPGNDAHGPSSFAILRQVLHKAGLPGLHGQNRKAPVVGMAKESGATNFMF